MLGSLILYLKGMRMMMFQLSGFYYKPPKPPKPHKSPKPRNPKPDIETPCRTKLQDAVLRRSAAAAAGGDGSQVVRVSGLRFNEFHV